MSDIFKRIEKERGMLARIYADFAAFPASVEAHLGMNKALILSESAPLPRHERGFLAYKTSEANGNDYCRSHHVEAFKNHAAGKDAGSRPRLLEELAVALTRSPASAAALHARFLAAGFTEQEWQHAVNVVSYFNYTNRFAFAMGISVESGFEKSCG